MKRKGATLLIPLGVLILAAASPLQAADEAVQRAMKQFKMNRYRDASTLYYQIPSSKTGVSGAAHLNLGVIFLKNAELYSELHSLSVKVHLDYLEKISAQAGKDRSLLSKVYLGEALLESGDPGRALEGLRSAAQDKGLKATARAVSRVGMGTAYASLGKDDAAAKVWSPMDGTNDPVVMSELALAYARFEHWNKDPEALCDRALIQAEKSGVPVPMRIISNCLGVYTRAGRVEKALELIRTVDLKAFSDEEELGTNKTVRFYSLSLLANLARLYQSAGVVFLEKAAADPGVAVTARYHLARAYAREGRTKESEAALDALTALQSKVPRRQHDAAMITHAANLSASGKKSDGIGLLSGLARQYGSDAHMLAEAVLVCAGFGPGCADIINDSALVAARGEGREYSRINFALGRYFLEKEDLDRALLYLEAGRDKSNKNRIEFNDPSLLTDLALTYYRTKKFSEALEILFGMSTQFPAVRQIQNAMQGIYSMEQKSAGDVKVL